MLNWTWNITFHGVGEPQKKLEPGEDKVWLSLDAFKMVLDVLKGRDDLKLTVDDGNVSDVNIVLPELLKRNLTAIFFVSPSKFESKGYMTQEDIEVLFGSGMTIGSHGVSHHDWRTLNDKELLEELSASKDNLEQIIGQPVIQAACPYGSYDRRVLKNLKKTGYLKVYTSDTGIANSNAWLQSRNTLHSSDTPESVTQLINQSLINMGMLVRLTKKTIKRWR